MVYPHKKPGAKKNAPNVYDGLTSRAWRALRLAGLDQRGGPPPSKAEVRAAVEAGRFRPGQIRECGRATERELTLWSCAVESASTRWREQIAEDIGT